MGLPQQAPTRLPDCQPPGQIPAPGTSWAVTWPPASPNGNGKGGISDPVVPPRTLWLRAGKSVVESLLALAILVLAAPLIFLAALLIKLTSRGPVFYIQTRVGKNGRLFTIYKLRTMYRDSEGQTGPVWSRPGDPRVTAVGKVLRATHFDEIPQLVNVLLQQMSLSGPRPERPEIAQALRAHLERYADRLRVRPGITGLAQMWLPPDTDLEAVRKKLVCDLHYVKHFGCWMDVRIFLCTGLFFLGIPLRFSRRLLRVPNPLRGPAQRSDSPPGLNGYKTPPDAPGPVAREVPR